jgi:hypothetical protein
MIPILIKKNPNDFINLIYNKEDFQSVINEVYLSDILDYIISAIDKDWAPKYYWSIKSKWGKMSLSELYWLIYSYLIHNKLLIIEDQYFGYNESRTKKYKDRLSYYNLLEIDLYQPILNKMVNHKYLTEINGYYKLGPLYKRKENLIKLGI